MKNYLIDENVHFGLANILELHATHATDISSRPSDEIIWKHATENESTIITKDFDFVEKIKATTPPPKVIHIKTGNMKRKEFLLFMKTNWPQISALSKNHKLVTVYQNRIEYFN